MKVNNLRKQNSIGLGLLIMGLMIGFLLFLNQKVLAVEMEAQVTSAPFLDVLHTHPHYVAISYLKEGGVVTGYEDKTYMPEAKINRAEVLRLILKGSEISNDQAFEAYYKDVTEGQWFTAEVMKAHQLGIVKENEGNKLFRPGDSVNLAEFLKMLLITNDIDVSPSSPAISNIPPEAWYAPYVNRAVALGLIPTQADGAVDPAQQVTRGEVAQTMYLVSILKNGGDTEFLLKRAGIEMGQIEVHILDNHVEWAKKASNLAVDFTQQAYKNNPLEAEVLGQAKLARAYDSLVEAILLAIEDKNEEAALKANEVIDKATEAWEADHNTQPIAAHLKEKARELLVQVGK